MKVRVLFSVVSPQPSDSSLHQTFEPVLQEAESTPLEDKSLLRAELSYKIGAQKVVDRCYRVWGLCVDANTVRMSDTSHAFEVPIMLYNIDSTLIAIYDINGTVKQATCGYHVKHLSIDTAAESSDSASVGSHGYDAECRSTRAPRVPSKPACDVSRRG
jgi:hypothetical protein